jgi:hypothetical protein
VNITEDEKRRGAAAEALSSPRKACHVMASKVPFYFLC